MIKLAAKINERKSSIYICTAFTKKLPDLIKEGKMVHFGKQALVYKYAWEILYPKGHVIRYGREDIIHRGNGFCVLEFINRFMNIHGLVRFQNFRKIEWLIHKRMPCNISKRDQMEEWLRDHWNINFYPNYY